MVLEKDARILWSKFCSNVSILQELLEIILLLEYIKERLSAVVEIRILKFFSHISRKGNDFIERLVVQERVDDTRPRGISSLRWTDEIKSVVGGQLHDCTRMAINK